MKKFFVLFLLLASCFILPFAQRANALAPVIIERSEFDYPSGFGQDQNYRSNQPNSDPTSEYRKTYSISESFDPECIGSSGGSCASYTHQTINQISQQLQQNSWTNNANRFMAHQWVYPIFQTSLTPEERSTALRNFRVNTQSPAYNSTVRMLDSRSKLCLLSRKIDQVAKFITQSSSYCIDEEVTDNIRFSQAILALNSLDSAYLQKKIGFRSIYFPNCEANTVPQKIPGELAEKLSSVGGQRPSDPVEYFFTHLQPGCKSSVAMSAQPCDLGSDGREDCKPKVEINMPFGAAPNSTADVLSFAIPVRRQTVANQDYSETVPNSATMDRPNPFNWVAKFFSQFYDDILDSRKNFSGNTLVKYFVPKETEKALDINLQHTYNFLPSADVDQLKQDDIPSSEDKTTGIGLHPGASNSKAIQYLKNSLIPCRSNPSCLSRL